MGGCGRRSGSLILVPAIVFLGLVLVCSTSLVNPDEAVAYGATVQGETLSGESAYETKNILLLEVLPFSYGIETEGGVMTTLIPKSSVNPIRKSQVFTTFQDQQTNVSIQAFVGEKKYTKDCRLIGKFNLSGIPPAPRGTPQIKVTYAVDANGMLTVTAEYIGTGKAEKIATKEVAVFDPMATLSQSEHVNSAEETLLRTIL